MNEHAYSTDDPATVAAFKATAIAYNEMGGRAREDAEKLGNNKGALIVGGVLGAPRVVGLAADDPANPPEGWQYVKGRDQLEPRRGKAGESARQWLAGHQPPDLRGVLAEHGLPVYYRNGNKIGNPALFLHDDTVWALYGGYPEGECTWTQRKLSEFHAAQEALEAAETAAKVEVPA